MTTNAPRVRVTTSPNRDYPGAVLLTFAEPCPYCGARHQHGSPDPEPGPSGDYGWRVPHCGLHSCERRADGRRKSAYRAPCRVNHGDYVLIPAESAQDAPGRRRNPR